MNRRNIAQTMHEKHEGLAGEKTGTSVTGQTDQPTNTRIYKNFELLQDNTCRHSKCSAEWTMQGMNES
jgi:hypothetical protein